MTDKEFKEQKKRLAKLMDFWVPALGLGRWKVDLLYVRESKDPQRGDGYAVYFDVVVKWEYETATIRAYMPELSAAKDHELEVYLLHEFAHIFINEMQSWSNSPEGKKHEERVATTISYAFQWIKQAVKEECLKKPKKLKK